MVEGDVKKLTVKLKEHDQTIRGIVSSLFNTSRMPCRACGIFI